MAAYDTYGHNQIYSPSVPLSKISTPLRPKRLLFPSEEELEEQEDLAVDIQDQHQRTYDRRFERAEFYREYIYYQNFQIQFDRDWPVIFWWQEQQEEEQE